MVCVHLFPINPVKILSLLRRDRYRFFTSRLMSVDLLESRNNKLMMREWCVWVIIMHKRIVREFFLLPVIKRTVVQTMTSNISSRLRQLLNVTLCLTFSFVHFCRSDS